MKKFLRSQKGFTLAELMIVIVISIVLAAYKLYPMFVEARLTKSSAQGLQLATLGNTVATYSTTYYGPLVGGTAIPGVVNIYAPTVSELKTLGLLGTGFSTVNMYNGGYGVRITKSPTGCVAPNCDIENLVYLTNAIINPANGRIDGPVLGQASQTLGADGGYSDTATPATISGAGGAWTVTNPVTNPSTGAPVAGILAMRSGYNSSTLAQFMRRDGQLPATGAQDMGGQNVNNVALLNTKSIRATSVVSILGDTYIGGNTSTNGITNTGALSTSTANVSGALTAGSVNVTGALSAGSATVSGALSAGSATVNGALTAGSATVNGVTNLNGGANVAGNLAVSGTTTTTGITNNGTLTNTGDIKAPHVFLTTIVAAGSSCAGYSGYQATTSTGQIASCVNGIWYANTPQPLSPCNATTVSWQGCTGTVPYTQSGSTASATMSTGTGNATYSCQNGSWGFLSGSCTPPPAGCPAQTISWTKSASCSGTSSAMISGTGHSVSSSNGNSGSVYANCTNGALTLTAPSCSTPSVTFYDPTANNGAYLSSNPTERTVFCQAMGYSGAKGSGTQSDNGGQNVPVCWSIDGNLNCSGGGNCSTIAPVNPGCYVQNSITCQ